MLIYCITNSNTVTPTDTTPPPPPLGWCHHIHT